MVGSLRECAEKLLREGSVKCVIGYESGSIPNTTRPCFINTPEEAKRLVWDGNCRMNLAKYVLGTDDRIGIVAKGCDGRALVELIKENQVKRENLVILAPECSGVFLPTKFGSTNKKAGTIPDHCRACEVRISPIYDIAFPKENRNDNSLAKKSSQQSDKTDWPSEFGKCIKCMACVKACPLCYCTECAIEGYKPLLVIKLRIPEELTTFQMIRALHMAGRCIECGACEFACPVGIPLTSLYSQLNKEVERILGYSPGLSLETKPPVKILEVEGVNG